MLALLVSVCLLSGWVADGRPSEEDPDVMPGEVDSFRFELIFLQFLLFKHRITGIIPLCCQNLTRNLACV